MNGIEKIIASIESESAKECAEIEAAAASERERVRAEYAKKEQEEYWRVFDAGAREAENRLKRLSSLAAVESKKQILTTQQEMVDQAFELAAQRILSLPEHEYVGLLARLACRASVTGSESMTLSPADYQRVGPKLLDAVNAALRGAGKPASVTLSDETAWIRGGFILSSGSIEVNCSIDELVSQQRNALIKDVASLLFD